MPQADLQAAKPSLICWRVNRLMALAEVDFAETAVPKERAGGKVQGLDSNDSSAVWRDGRVFAARSRQTISRSFLA